MRTRSARPWNVWVWITWISSTFISLPETGWPDIGSRNVDHIRDNLNILDFTLTEDEMNQIAVLDKGVRYYHRTEEQLVQFAGWKPAFEMV